MTPSQNIANRIGEIERYIYSAHLKFSELKSKIGMISNGYSTTLNDSNWKDFHIGEKWGKKEMTQWFRLRFSIPTYFKGKKVVLKIKLADEPGEYAGPECLAFLNGYPVQKISVDGSEILLTDSAKGNEKYVLAIEGFCGSDNRRHTFKIAELVAVEKDIENLYWNLKVAFEVANLIENSEERMRILSLLESTPKLPELKTSDSVEFYSSIREIDEYLKKNVFIESGNSAPKVIFVGQSHIDIAYMWRISQGRKKCAATFSTVLKFMEEYPEYYFIQSQPQLYRFIKIDYPFLYEEIKKRVKENRWEAEGGMWVEADCNLPSGESLVRQILFGKKFFKKEFGVNSKILWLPDTFGFSWVLPQIIKKSGMEYFMTTKLSYNQYNEFPYDTFLWKGIDGTEIVAYFITTPHALIGEHTKVRTFNGELVPEMVKSCWDNYRHKNINNEVLFAFGRGDGGGGPTKEMLEYGKRLTNLPGFPVCKHGRAIDFFEKLKKIKNLPVWNDELYGEFHRGTYTTESIVKRYNRESEILYHNLELFSVLNWLLIGNDYSQDEINKGWDLILLNQFHDILAGSSIREVYEDCEKDYEVIRKIGKKILTRALRELSASISLGGDSVIIFNPLSWERIGVASVKVDGNFCNLSLISIDGENLPYQVVEDKDGEKKVIFETPFVAAFGYRAIKIKKALGKQKFLNRLKATRKCLENRFFRVSFDKNGQIISIYDKINSREVISEGRKANQFQAFEDKPVRDDAWEIDISYLDKPWKITDLISLEVIEEGPVRAGLNIKRTFLKSKINQNIYIYSNIPRIDFETEINWQEEHVLLKVAFPVKVHSDRATYDIQFGNIERPTHWKTSLDKAKFEVWAHKWADLSKSNYGVSLLNNCKYGYDVKDNVMRLTILRSATFPDPKADKGLHRLIYSLYPHQGDWKKGETIKNAYELNYPLIGLYERAHKGKLLPDYSFVKVSREGIIIETVKKEEEGNDIILRVYECYNQKGKVRLDFAHQINFAYECNLIEEEKKGMNFEENRLFFTIMPYEIKTFSLNFRKVGHMWAMD